MFLFIGVLVFLVVFLVVCYKMMDVDGYVEVYKQEREGTHAIQELSEDEKQQVAAFVSANFPDKVNEEILSATISTSRRTKLQQQ